MNIREIKEMILNETYTSQSELHDQILAYLNDRILTFEMKIDTRENRSILKSIYRLRLIGLLNPTLQEKTRHEIFFCDEHTELEIVDADDIISTSCGDQICRDAFDNYYFECSHCSDIHHQDDRFFVDSRSQDEYCQSCYDENSHWCDDCETTYHRHDNCECNEDREDDEVSNLDKWDTKNVIHNLGREHSIRFYGIEVEVQVFERHSRNDIVDMFRDCFNKDKQFIVCKRDGSLHTEKGFELSSTNASFKIHKEEFWNDFFELNPAQYVKAYNGYQCGIHIHFNRSAFTYDQLRRLNIFYHNPENRKLITDIAGRDPNGYCRFVEDIDYHSPIKTSGNDNKYRAINFRIFKSNIKQISFFRYLEFVHTVNNWILETTHDYNNNHSDYDTSKNNYFDWLLKNIHKDYSNLLIFLDDKNYFDHLQHIEQWNDIYTNFKTVVHDFRINNEELIRQESEE
jgi:hypothetical protein